MRELSKIKRALKRTVTFALACSLLMSVGCAEPPAVKKTIYDPLAIGEYPIGIYWGPPPDFINEESYKTIADGGFNYVLGRPDDTLVDIMSALDYAADNGIKFLPRHIDVTYQLDLYELNKDKENFDPSKYTDIFHKKINEYVDHPGYGGQMLIDEPEAEFVSTVSAFTADYLKEYPENTCYTNLLPMASIDTAEITRYTEYVTTFVEKSGSDFISFDNYPCMEDGTELNTYYMNLSIVSKIARDFDIPMFAYMQSMGYYSPYGIVNARRNPSERDFRWQAFSSLAYGAKSLSYFLYWSIEASSSATEIFDLALILTDGTPNDSYYIVKRLNSHIKQIGNILLPMKHVGTMYNKGINAFETLYDLESFAPISAFTGKGALLGCFEDEQKYAILLANESPRDTADITLSFADSVSSYNVYKLTNDVYTPYEQSAGTDLRLNLPAGEGLLITINK